VGGKKTGYQTKKRAIPRRAIAGFLHPIFSVKYLFQNL